MSAPRKLLLAYSTNVHRGEGLGDIYRFMTEFTVPIARRVFGGGESGLELCLGSRSSRELSRRKNLEAFRTFLGENRLALFSVNAFPLLDFHAARVKERVYRPSWDEPERSRATNRIAGILAALLPEGVQGSISTLGGIFRPRGHDPPTFRRLAAGYLKTLESLARLEAETGKTIVLAVEPEPDTTMETARDVIDFFEAYLFPVAREVWRRRGISRSQCESILRKFFTVNFDTCHFSVLFRDLVGSLHELERAGLGVGKIHATSAISLCNPYDAPAAYARFRGMQEPRYFHQFCGRDESGVIVWRGLDLDALPRRLVRGRHPYVSELRSHYHVPLCLGSWNRLDTTRDETRALVVETVRRRLCSQFVVETYTWPILRGEARLVEGISREISWLRGALGEAGMRGRSSRKAGDDKG